MTRALAIALVCASLSGCSRRSGEQGHALGSALPLAAPTPASDSSKPAAAKQGRAKSTTKTLRKLAGALSDGATPAQESKALSVADDTDLRAEEQEANPYSEAVTLKLSVTPQVKALVMWGAKQMAKLAPGGMETEIARPRGSGPLDLEIRADGYLPYHTRLYADRNDKVSVRLYRGEEAPGLFGYRRSAAEKAPKKK